jgi:predicted Zn-dependent peptidase
VSEQEQKQRNLVLAAVDAWQALNAIRACCGRAFDRWGDEVGDDDKEIDRIVETLGAAIKAATSKDALSVYTGGLET